MEEQLTANSPSSLATPLSRAAVSNPRLSWQGVLERLFVFSFDGLVYPQIWEDPVIDMEAMEIAPGNHIVAIASGGCNVMSYLAADPGKITAVDLNEAHLALLELKSKAAQALPGHAEYFRFFAGADSPSNVALYHQAIEPLLSPPAKEYWSQKRFALGSRIGMFSRGFYRYGLLGRFITAVHLLARLYGIKPSDLMKSASLEEQRRYFNENIDPLFDSRLLRMITSTPLSLFGLGIPPAQYTELADGRHVADVLRERLGRLINDFPISENYFARQAFGRAYGDADNKTAYPPYLEAHNWDSVRGGADRVRAVNAPITDLLMEEPANSVDRFVFLDSQDWMNVAQINALWAAATRAAAPGARIIFRTAGTRSPVESKVAPEIAANWFYEAEKSRTLGARDRSAIYGAFHLYRLK